MKNTVLYIAIVFLVFALSCKKKEFPEMTHSSSITDYVFKASGLIDGEQMTFNAGANGYMLSTNVETIEEGDYILSSEFALNNCEECFPKLKISLNSNSGNYQNSEFDMESLQAGDYDFQPSVKVMNRLVLSDELAGQTHVNNAIVNGFFAGVNEHEIANEDTPIEINYLYQSPQVNVNNNHWFMFVNDCYTVDHHVDIFSIDYNVSSGQINISPPNIETPGEYSWLLTYTINNQIVLDSIVQPSGMVNDLTFSIAGVQDQIDEFFLVMVFRGDNGDLIIERQNNISSSNDFTIESIPIEIFDVPQINVPAFEVAYVDAQGERFVSTVNCLDFTDNDERIFNVSSVTDYELNADGLPTVKFDFSTSCTLINPETLEKIELEDFQGVIAMPIPN